MNRKHLVLIFIALFSLTSCTTSQVKIKEGDLYKPITRNEVMEIADIYLKHKWRPTKKNVFHGIDKDGIRVNTPDIDSTLPSKHPGWWIPDSVNIGLPYMWGGFCSIEEFDKGIREGKYAGDIYTQYKRNNLGKAVSRYAVGIDCSGFVSRCWKLPSHHSTRNLSSVANMLSDATELKKGDILNKHNAHVFLFKEFYDKEKTRATVIHATSHKVKQKQVLIRDLIEDGFKLYRYKKIVD